MNKRNQIRGTPQPEADHSTVPEDRSRSLFGNFNDHEVAEHRFSAHAERGSRSARSPLLVVLHDRQVFLAIESTWNSTRAPGEPRTSAHGRAHGDESRLRRVYGRRE